MKNNKLKVAILIIVALLVCSLSTGFLVSTYTKNASSTQTVIKGKNYDSAIADINQRLNDQDAESSAYLTDIQSVLIAQQADISAQSEAITSLQQSENSGGVQLYKHNLTFTYNSSPITIDIVSSFANNVSGSTGESAAPFLGMLEGRVSDTFVCLGSPNFIFYCSDSDLYLFLVAVEIPSTSVNYDSLTMVNRVGDVFALDIVDVVTPV